ncbi:CACTA en-spm transposon protein [Cucumis melo var. makuwa]|uniref:CACTA en-spm transposon protein n=1 Tax=Cucumis melo var. makuwa TaxID=1194695 RepID=A0A5A7VG07_CUCMM|nr:CACTA en-spm transposon protein [Cucumis melo var. makuwa]
MDALFLEFADDLDNLTGESSLVGDNSGSSSQPPATPTLKRCAQSRLLELERYVAANGRILMTIALDNTLRSSRLTPAMNRFVKHQMLSTFKEFRGDCHRYFKKYSDPEEARANPPNLLVGCDEDWYFLCDYYMTRAFQVNN